MSCGNPHETPCSEVQDLLDLYLDQELDHERSTSITVHFAECNPCYVTFVLVRTVKTRVHGACCNTVAPESLRISLIGRFRGEA